MSRDLVLASASPARLRLLAAAGFAPEVVVSGVDETAVHAAGPAELVAALAIRKAESVARLRPQAVVVGCDSLLDLDGQALGKPADSSAALERWALLSGREGVLRTGHCVIADGRQVSAVASTTVRFGRPSPAEVAAYVATGEPLGVAGGFTLDGRSAPFIEGVDGDPGNVIGLSLPLLRKLFSDLGLGIVDLWH